MPFTFLVDSTYNDFRIKDGDMVLVSGEDAVVQQIRATLQTQLGEWFLNVNFGIPYYSLSATEINNNASPGILGGNLSAAEIQSYVTLATQQVPGVLRVEEFLIEEGLEVRVVFVQMKVLIASFENNGIGTQHTVSVSLGA